MKVCVYNKLIDVVLPLDILARPVQESSAVLGFQSLDHVQQFGSRVLCAEDSILFADILGVGPLG